MARAVVTRVVVYHVFSRSSRTIFHHSREGIGQILHLRNLHQGYPVKRMG